mmetsp:Transcript_121464/g.214887  ORF Transcript_121464/g.214887 Transcript_121464/m.214887 type:complete len:417 (-) Transcript_121464:195-1445(-)
MHRLRNLGPWSLLVAFSCGLDFGRAVEAPVSCSGVDVSSWTSASWQAKGYHVLCIGGPAADCSGGESGDETCQADGQIKITACWGGKRNQCEEFNVQKPETLLSFEEEVSKRAALVNSKRRKRLQGALEKKGKWKGLFAFFSVATDEMPAQIKSVDSLSGLILAFEGGTFVWPGIEIGFRRNVSLSSEKSKAGLSVQLLTRSLQPLVIEVSSFLDESECNHIIEKARPHMAESDVSHMDHDVGKPNTDWRSSKTYFMPSDDDITRRLDKRVSALTRIKVSHQEFAQVLRYDVRGRYAAHHDYFDPDMYKGSEQIQSLTKKGLFNRLATVFFYLTTVEGGGHTNFPRAGGGPQPASFEDCSEGVSVSPERGRIIIFYSMDPSGSFDEYSLHGGCAVSKGTKWSVNKWIWNKPMSFIS